MSAPNKLKFPEKYEAFCRKQSLNKQGVQPWNTGLTKETDIRVKKQAELPRDKEWRENISKGNTGKVRTPEQRLHQSVIRVLYPGGRGVYYKNIPAEIIERLGGHCTLCGMSNEESNTLWNRNLDLHHHLGVKNFQISDGIQRTKMIGEARTIEEALMLCTPLCVRCHARKTNMGRNRKVLKF